MEFIRKWVGKNSGFVIQRSYKARPADGIHTTTPTHWRTATGYVIKAKNKKAEMLIELQFTNVIKLVPENTWLESVEPETSQKS